MVVASAIIENEHQLIIVLLSTRFHQNVCCFNNNTMEIVVHIEAEANDFIAGSCFPGLEGGRLNIDTLTQIKQKKAVKRADRESKKSAGVALFELITIFYAKAFFIVIFLFTSVPKIPPSIDFAVTWFALSNGFWNPFLYWLLNAHFRSISHDMISSKVSDFKCR